MLIDSQMAKKTARRQRPRTRAEQQRSIETRASILDAAIAEFSQRGFEGASIRAIADRLGLQHPLITYHYRSKDILWRAAADHALLTVVGEHVVIRGNYFRNPWARVLHLCWNKDRPMRQCGSNDAPGS